MLPPPLNMSLGRKQDNAWKLKKEEDGARLLEMISSKETSVHQGEK
jgi:hypothetical protein